MLLGHHAQRRQLLAMPPGQPVLLAGPSGIGKAEVARAVAYHYADAVDALVLRPVRMDDVRTLTAWATTPPIGTKGKAAALDLDGSVPAVAQALLKILEEPPASTWLVLSASGTLPATLSSRVHTVTFHPLSDADTLAVLSASGVMGSDADRLTNLAGGRPGYALGFREAIAARARVLTLMAAIERRDWGLVTTVLRGRWEPGAVTALQLWLADVLANTTRAYAPGERYGLDVLVPRANLVAAEAAAAMPVPPALAVSLAARKILG